MKSTILILILCLTFLSLDGGLAWFAHTHARHAETDLAFLNRDRAAIAAQGGRLREQIDAHRAALAHLSSRPAQRRSDAPAGATSAGRSNPLLTGVAKNPKLVPLYLKAFAARLPERFASFYRAQELPPEQIARFEAALTKREAGKIDLIASAAAQGLPAGDAALAEMSRQQDQALKSEQTAILGEAGYQQLEQFNRAQGADAVTNAAAVYAVETEPFSGSQMNRLTEIVAGASASYRQGANFDVKTVDWSSVLAQSASFLTPAQLEALQVPVRLARLGQMTQSYFAHPQ